MHANSTVFSFALSVSDRYQYHVISIIDWVYDYSYIQVQCIEARNENTIAASCLPAGTAKYELNSGFRKML